MDYDDAYANGAYIPNAERYLEDWADAASEHRQVEAAFGRALLNQPYGPSERERYDVFYPSGRPEGLLVFVHGGYWRMLEGRDFSHLAAGAQQRGWAVAVPTYTLTPEVGISQITQQVAAMVRKVANHTQGPIVLVGHSAGGQLVSRMVMGDVDIGAAAARVRRVVPISPVADLRPLRHTKMNEDFQMNEAEAEAESPAMGKKALPVPVDIWVGAEERPAFLDQARWLSEAWGAGITIAPGHHHFSIIEGLADPESALLNACLSG